MIKTESGPSYTQPQLVELLNAPKSPTGLVLSDKQQLFASVVADIDTQNPNNRNGNHSGFSITVYEPAAWLGALKAKAVKEFKPFGPDDVSAEDRLPVLRVIVQPDSPEYMTAVGVARANSVEHVVLRSMDRRLVAQPFSVAPTTWTVQNGLGARLAYAGLVAVFSLTDLDKIRAATPSREFFVTIIGERKNSTRDFEIKRKFFDQMGDVAIIPSAKPVSLVPPKPGEIPRAASVSKPVTGSVDSSVIDGVNQSSVLYMPTAAISTSLTNDPVIDRAREAAAMLIETMPDYAVKQFTTRYMTAVTRDRGTSWRALDTVTADLVYQDGKESYKNFLVNGRTPLESPEKSGSWSSGEFASTLQDIFSPITNADFHNKRSTTISNHAAFRYDFSVEQQNSHWHVAAQSQSYQPQFTGSVWIDKETYRVLRIELAARNMPMSFPLDQVESSIDYDYVLIGDQKYLLPTHSEALSCVRGTKDCNRNTIEFRNYAIASGRN